MIDIPFTSELGRVQPRVTPSLLRFRDYTAVPFQPPRFTQEVMNRLAQFPDIRQALTENAIRDMLEESDARDLAALRTAFDPLLGENYPDL